MMRLDSLTERPMNWFRFLAAATALVVSPTHALDLTDDRDLVEAYVKTVGDMSGKPTIAYARAIVMSHIPGEKGRKLFALEVVGASRYLKIDGGYQRLNREVGLYTDLETGEVLERWYNPYLQREVEVLHIQNDPVNFPYTVAQQSGPRRIAYQELGDYVAFHREVQLFYPSAIKRADYPMNSHGDWYRAAELFNSYVLRSELDDPDVTSARVFGSWSRIGPWLPWMEMGNSTGELLYHGRSHKLLGGVDEIPAPVRAYIERYMPKYLTAPDAMESPNETSWTYFKKVLDGRRFYAGTEVDDEFCARAQRVTTATRQPVNNIVHEAFRKFTLSKPQIGPLETQQYVWRADDEPLAVSCKLKTTDHIETHYGPGNAPAQRGCADINRATLDAILQSLPIKERAEAEKRAANIVFVDDRMMPTGPDWLAPYTMAERKRGKIEIEAKGFRGDWLDPRLAEAPPRFKGTHYCHLVAPAYMKRLLAGNATLPSPTIGEKVVGDSGMNRGP